MGEGTMKPSILLVEDDATSCAYLSALTRTLPATVETAGDIATAMRMAAAHRHDLWLIDAHLPDGSGVDLLRALRDTMPATPALAHTAARERSELDPLIAAGFAEVLVKPVDSATWLGAIRRALGRSVADQGDTREPAPSGKLPVWDDATAAAALGGNMDNVAALRSLFLGELPAQVQAVRAGGDARRDQLHRLRASCGFVGAARLEAAVRQLQASADPAVLQAFLDAAADTLEQAPGT